MFNNLQVRWRFEGSKVATQNLKVHRQEKDHSPKERFREVVVRELGT